MAEPLDPKDHVTIEDLAISSMWEIAALARDSLLCTSKWGGVSVHERESKRYLHLPSLPISTA